MDVERVEGRLLGALAGWAGASALAGATLAVVGRRARRPAMAGFGLQSVAWAAVDGAIAASGLARRGRRTPGTARLRRLLLVNVGADVGYVVVGALLLARPAAAAPRLRSTPAALHGHAAAVVVQGAYLLVADALAAAALAPGPSSAAPGR